MRPDHRFLRLVSRSWIAGAAFVFVAGTARAGDWYVDLNAPAGGDGSAAHPFQAIKTALNHSIDGDRILVSAGLYVEYLTSQTSISILGDAAGGTTISPLPTKRTALTISAGKSVWIQDLTLTGTSNYDGGGLNNAGTTIAVRCHVTGCHAKGGGGVYNTGTLVMWGCVVDQCVAAGGDNRGGGIWNAATLKLFDCTVADNTAADTYSAAGGGIWSSSSSSPDTSVLRLVNVTVCGNSASTGYHYAFGTALGGGLYCAGKVSIDHSTIAGNDATDYSWTINGNGLGGGYLGNPADVTHSIIANNHSSNGTDADFSGTCNSLGYLLIRDTSGTTIQGDLTGVQTGVDPLLKALADNGGLVPTVALDPASPCIDAGNSDPFASPTHDARDFPRALWDAAVGPSDLGAYESGSTPSYLLTATPDVPLPPGATVALTTGGGIGGHAFALALVDVNGTPLFVPVVITTFDASGVFELPAVVPAGLSGSTAGFQTFALDANGRSAATNVATLIFQ